MKKFTGKVQIAEERNGYGVVITILEEGCLFDMFELASIFETPAEAINKGWEEMEFTVKCLNN